MVETEPSFTLSCCDTPLRQLAHATRLLPGASRSKRKEKGETFTERGDLKEEERKWAELTTVFLIGNLDKRIDSRILLKRERIKEGRHHYGAGDLVAAIALTSKSKGSTSLRHSKATEPEEEPVIIGSEKEQQAGVVEPEESAAVIPETVAVLRLKGQRKPKPFKASSLEF